MPKRKNKKARSTAVASNSARRNAHRRMFNGHGPTEATTKPEERFYRLKWPGSSVYAMKMPVSEPTAIRWQRWGYGLERVV